MFSIENLLSNKYTSKSPQNAKNRDQVESIGATTQTFRKVGGGGGVTEVNSFAGKRDILYLELSTANARSSADGAKAEKETVDITLENPPTKMTVMIPGKVEGRGRKRLSDGGEEESESDSDERDSGSEEGTLLYDIAFGLLPELVSSSLMICYNVHV